MNLDMCVDICVDMCVDMCVDIVFHDSHQWSAPLSELGTAVRDESIVCELIAQHRIDTSHAVAPSCGG